MRFLESDYELLSLALASYREELRRECDARYENGRAVAEAISDTVEKIKRMELSLANHKKEKLVDDINRQLEAERNPLAGRVSEKEFWKKIPSEVEYVYCTRTYKRGDGESNRGYPTPLVYGCKWTSCTTAAWGNDEVGGWYGVVSGRKAQLHNFIVGALKESGNDAEEELQHVETLEAYGARKFNIDSTNE